MQAPLQASRVRFGAFEVDLRSGELRKHGLKVKLQDQPFQILVLLLERPGEVVTREELQRQLWPADTFVDFDVGLNSAIKRLRDALCDTAESQRYIETLPKHGYRFVASVEKENSQPSSVTPDAERASTSELVAPASTPTRAEPRRRTLLMAVFALGATLVAAFGVGALWHRVAGTAPHPIRSIAVLPLENLSHDQEQEYFADGMTEALVTNLGKVDELRVISRTSVMRYKGTKKPLQEIARELQVDALVEGTVTRSADRVRITANLVQASPEKHVWADSFERELRDVLALQNDVSRAIVKEIQISLTPQERTRLTNTRPVDPGGYEAYLEGRYFWEKLWGDPVAAQKATEYYKLAIAKDPNWALPYSGLAETYAVAGANAAIPNESCTNAKATALNAVEKDDTVAETHTILGEIEFWCEWDWAGADRDLRRAIEVNPSFARAHSSYSRYLLAMGRINEALAESKRAVELDPLSLRIRWDRWLLFYYTGQYVPAEEQCRKIQEIDPTNNLGHLYCGDVALAKGDFAQAIRELQESVSLSQGGNPGQGGNPRAVAHLGYAYAVAGRTADAQNILAQLKKMSTRQYVHPVLVARVCAVLGQRQEALEWLEAGYRVQSRDLLELKYDPRLVSLRSDPRFRDLLRRVGLPQ
jgi:TolB-like protein/DNA-binding winged helix-turn-helix (wHTH) protein/Flp pilus assembly protein TadD